MEGEKRSKRKQAAEKYTDRGEGQQRLHQKKHQDAAHAQHKGQKNPNGDVIRMGQKEGYTNGSEGKKVAVQHSFQDIRKARSEAGTRRSKG